MEGINEIEGKRTFHFARELVPAPAIERRKRLNHSNFLITINTNSVFRNDPESEALLSAFEPVIKHLTELPLDQLITIIEPNTPMNKDSIKTYLIDAKPETGPTDNKLHAHILVSVQHWTKVRLQFDFIKKYIQDSLGDKAPYVYYKPYYRSTDNNIDTILQNYVHKGVVPANNP